MTESERISKLLEVENIKASQFAALIGVQSSTLSNILSGRNKPSLEVMQKILLAFPQISSEWLILDREPIYRKKNDSQQLELFPTENSQTDIIVDDDNSKSDNRHAVKLLIIYSDHTFEELSPLV